MEARWRATGDKQDLRDSGEMFRYRFREATCEIRWRALRRGALVESIEGAPQNVTYAAIGRERNRDFF